MCPVSLFDSREQGPYRGSRLLLPDTGKWEAITIIEQVSNPLSSVCGSCRLYEPDSNRLYVVYCRYAGAS
jgi:hypothetical protein